MAVTLDQLVLAQMQIQALFGRPLAVPPDGKFPPEVQRMIDIARTPGDNLDPGHVWGFKNIEGVAVGWPADPNPDAQGKDAAAIDLYLTSEPPPGFLQVLKKFFADIELNWLVTGPFQFLAGMPLGSSISVKGHGTEGTIGVFLRTRLKRYALTCAHVLDGDIGAQLPVLDGQGNVIGTLTNRVDLKSTGTNAVDCALAKLLDAVVCSNDLPGALPKVAGISKAANGKPVTVVKHNGKTNAGTVQSDRVDVTVRDGDLGSISFDNVIAVKCAGGIVGGDSGSLVIDGDNCAVGIVFGKSRQATTPKGIEQGPLVIVSDLKKIIDELTAQPGSDLAGLDLL